MEKAVELEYSIEPKFGKLVFMEETEACIIIKMPDYEYMQIQENKIFSYFITNYGKVLIVRTASISRIEEL